MLLEQFKSSLEEVMKKIDEVKFKLHLNFSKNDAVNQQR